MKIHKNFNINNSLGIKSIAKFFIEIENIKDFEELFNFISSKDISSSLLIIGEGTNLVLPETFDGIVVKPMFNHINYDKNNNLISVGASVNWDYFVDLMVKDNIFGFENLSLIPGSVGAAPIQNIGAYGQSISSLISSIDCFDFKLNKFVNLSNQDCDFDYRHSILKDNNYIIYNVNFTSNNISECNYDYDSIKKYILELNLDPKLLTLKDTRNIICKIRERTLPNHLIIPNVGSFFKNPIVQKKIINQEYFSLNNLIIWPLDSNVVKIGAARLIDLIKEELDEYDNVSISSTHSLVLVNPESKASQKEILNYASHIKDIVQKKFNISLEIEPTIIN